MNHAVIIIPTYNERENIQSIIVETQGVIRQLAEKFAGFRCSILVVDDNSPDGTAAVVRTLAKKYSNISLLSGEKQGLGTAYVRGMEYAIEKLKASVVVEMDADGQHDPKLLLNMFKKIQQGADFVIGSRYIAGGSIPQNWGIHRKIYSLIGNAIIRFGLGKLRIHDWTSGYRALRSDVFTRVHHGLGKYTGYTFQVALLNRAENAGFTIAEVPLQFVDRRFGHSKIAPLEYISNLLFYVLKNSTFLKYLIVGVLGFTIQTVAAKLLVWLQFFPGVAVGVGAFLAIVANFIGNNYFTFSHRKISGIKTMIAKFSHFLTTSIGALLIQIVVVTVGVFMFGHDAWFMLMVFAIGFLVIPYNFFIYNRFIWKKHEK